MRNKIGIGIIGAGNIGCIVGAHLIQAGAEVTFLGRPRLGEKIKAHGLSVDGGHTIPAEEVHWVTSPTDLPKVDVVIFAVKSQDTNKAALEVASYLKQDCLILSFQNGLQNKSKLKEVFPFHTVLSAMVSYNVVSLKEGTTFKQTTKGHIYLEKFDDERLSFIKPPYFQMVDNIEEIQCGKLLRNLNNALNALSNKPLLEQLGDIKERRLLSKVVEEALVAMKQNGLRPKNTSFLPIELLPHVLKLPDFLFELILKKEVSADPMARLSMWNDLETGRKTEIDFLNGEIVSLAREVGFAVPFNERIVALIKLAENGKVTEARAQYVDFVSKTSVPNV